GLGHTLSGVRATIAGGDNHTNLSADAVIGGGNANTILTNSPSSTIGGGQQNTIQSNAFGSLIAGGSQNTIASGFLNGTISGGSYNAINGTMGTIAGGFSNAVGSPYAAVPGGYANVAGGDYSFAAGRRAKANQDGTFVWADDTDADFSSTTNKQFAIRANNGLMLQATNTALDLRGGGAIKIAGAGLGASTPVFTHRAIASNITGDYTAIDHPLCNNDPNAILLVTQNWNPGGAGGTYNAHPVGVFYTGSRWAVFNQDLAAMPVNAAFNVMVIKP